MAVGNDSYVPLLRAQKITAYNLYSVYKIKTEEKEVWNYVKLAQKKSVARE